MSFWIFLLNIFTGSAILYALWLAGMYVLRFRWRKLYHVTWMVFHSSNAWLFAQISDFFTKRYLKHLDKYNVLNKDEEAA